MDRGVYSTERLTAEGLRRTNPEMYERNLAQGYIRGVVEDRPAVITVNMVMASLAVNDFLADSTPIATSQTKRSRSSALTYPRSRFTRRRRPRGRGIWPGMWAMEYRTVARRPGLSR